MEHFSDRPPDPPDTGTDGADLVIDNSPPLFSESTPELNRKRRLGENNDLDARKKAITSPDLASASIQTIYTHSSLTGTDRTYNQEDAGPFLVHVTREESHPASSISIKPIKFGQFLHQNKINNIVRDGVKRVGRNRVAVEFRTAEDANLFLQNPALKDNCYKASIPTFNITRMGVVKQVPLDMSMDEFVASLELPHNCGIVLKARRMNRKIRSDGISTWVPTQSVVLTFRGQILPDKIYSYHVATDVEIYHYPTIICLACSRYGHVQAQCRSKPRCYKCSGPHLGESCEVSEENASCVYCTDTHFSNSTNCPEKSRQRAMKLLMAQENISFSEAASRVPTTRKSYASVASSSPPLTTSTPSQVKSPPQNQISYRKTVFTPRRPRSPVGKGYDKQAHQRIVSEIPSSFPNGHLLMTNTASPITPNDNLIEMLLSTVICIISKFNDSIPPNVAEKLNQLVNMNNNNYGSSPSVEHPEPAAKEI
ncbi:hypothetical protein JYU34_008887 [Plutella xylostella]|uniref:Gag-like protein n=1 Tax=Plutella xylostella TaxID=51655 RepID=A0ABQ7QM28_PLUXY|nr:hypothetical protein JYU34_008887 [Plutella xylostella]